MKPYAEAAKKLMMDKHQMALESYSDAAIFVSHKAGYLCKEYDKSNRG